MTSRFTPDGKVIASFNRGLLKDLLYTRGNVSLDIARLSSMLSVLAFWGGVGWHVWRNGAFDPVAVGTGCAALMAGCAGWIFFRQQHEAAPGGEQG
jgi:hypothetical protein